MNLRNIPYSMQTQKKIIIKKIKLDPGGTSHYNGGTHRQNFQLEYHLLVLSLSVRSDGTILHIIDYLYKEKSSEKILDTSLTLTK